MRVARHSIGVFAIVLGSLCAAAGLQPPRPGKNEVSVRGQILSVYLIPAPDRTSHCQILYAPGDGGWRGFGVTIAEELSKAGCDVYGLDTRVYLQSFSNPALNPAEIAEDYRTLALWIRQNSAGKVLLAGWSEGAGLAIAAASSSRNHDVLKGAILIDTTELNILSWHWSDLVAEVRKIVPNEPTFATRDYIDRVAPLPLFMIASSQDEYVTPAITKSLFGQAKEPKALAIIDSNDHKFSGRTADFFRTLAQAIRWISQKSS